jgi:drug/metabolite transporter (DMT)-like permease
MMQCLVCGLCYFAIDSKGTIDAAIGYTPRDWALMLFLVVFCSVFAFVAQLWAIKKTSASRASLLLATEPIWAVAVGSVLGAELLGPIGYLGAAVIIGASFYGQRIEATHREKQTTKSQR